MHYTDNGYGSMIRQCDIILTPLHDIFHWTILLLQQIKHYFIYWNAANQFCHVTHTRCSALLYYMLDGYLFLQPQFIHVSIIKLFGISLYFTENSLSQPLL